MNLLQNIAAIAQILSFPTGAYCAYVSYLALHPLKPGETAPMFSETWLAISFGAFVTCLTIMLAAWFLKVNRTPREPTVTPKGSIAKIVKAGALQCRAGEAEAFITILEDTRELYDTGRVEVLLYPLSSKTLPDEVKEWRHKELLKFRNLYNWHIHSIKNIAPDFHSKVIDEAFPSEARYLDVKRNLKEHASLLRRRADALVNRPSDANEG
jgi:hypothetical protein